MRNLRHSTCTSDQGELHELSRMIRQAQNSNFPLPLNLVRDNWSENNSTSTVLMATALALQETAKIIQNSKKMTIFSR